MADKDIAVADTAPKSSKLDDAIDAWHRDHFAGSSTTAMWNLSFAAKEDLKKRLAKI